MAMQDDAFLESISLILRFLKDYGMNETLQVFENEIQLKAQSPNATSAIPPITQLVQGFLDLKIKSDKIKVSTRRLEFPILNSMHKIGASIVACKCSDSILAISCTDKRICIFNVQDNHAGIMEKEIQADQVILCMDIHKNLFLTAGMGGTIRLYDIRTTELKFQVKDHAKYVTSCGFSSNGEKFFTGSHDGIVNIYQSDKETYQKVFSRKFKGAVESGCVIDNIIYVSIRGDCFVHTIDFQDYKALEKNMNSNGDDWVSFTGLHLSSSPDNNFLLILTDTEAGRFIVFQISTWTKVADVWGELRIDRFSHPRGIWIDSEHFMIGDDEGYQILWNINEQGHIGKIKAHDAAIRGLARNGSTLYVGSFDQSLSVWNFKQE